MRDFQNYRVWEKAHRLTLAVYAATVDFPREEPYGLRTQIRRSCASVPANIAEGCGHDTDTDFARFLEISAGSACNLEYYLLLARDLDLLESSEHARLDAGAASLRQDAITSECLRASLPRTPGRRRIAGGGSGSRRPLSPRGLSDGS